jgi:hypothetical protein
MEILGLYVTEDSNGKVVFGIAAKGHEILDPSMDEGLTNSVEPSYYGLTDEQVAFFNKLNQVLDDASEEAQNAGCLAIQRAMGIATGDVAGIHFSRDHECAPIRSALAKCLLTEVHRKTYA